MLEAVATWQNADGKTCSWQPFGSLRTGITLDLAFSFVAEQ
jgi:hypothetical protein